MRTCDSGLPNLVNRADTSSAFMCCGFRFKDPTCKPREECARSRRQSRERPRTRSIGSFIPMRRFWQEESFDHVLRSSESLDAKIDYVLQNPVRKGLVRIAREYPWSWRKPMDHQDRSRRGGCPHPPSDAEHRKTLASTARQPGRGRPGLREPWWLGAVKVQSQTEKSGPCGDGAGTPSGSRRRLRWATHYKRAPLSSRLRLLCLSSQPS